MRDAFGVIHCCQTVGEMPADFWESHGAELESWKEEGRTYYRFKGPLANELSINEFVYDAKADSGFDA